MKAHTYIKHNNSLLKTSNKMASVVLSLSSQGTRPKKICQVNSMKDMTLDFTVIIRRLLCSKKPPYTRTYLHFLPIKQW